MKRYGKLQLGFGLIFVLWCSDVLAQGPPAAAKNRQDEVVNIVTPPARDDGLMTIFRSENKEEVSRYVSNVVELKHADGFEIMPYVKEAVGKERGQARALKYAPPEGGKVRHFISVVTTERQMPSIIQMIEAFDLPGMKSDQGDTKSSIRVRYRRASELASILQNRGMLSPVGTTFADDITNTLFVYDTAAETVGDLAHVEFYDVPPPQVSFDVQIIEVREDNAGKLGLDWEAWKRSLGGQADATGNHFEGGKSFARLDWLLTLDARTLAEFLNYAVQSGHANTVKRAKVTADNLTPAVISSYKRVPVFDYRRTDQEPSVVTEANPRVNSSAELRADNPDGNRDYPRVVSIRPSSYFTREDIGTDVEGLAIKIEPVIGTDMVTAHIAISASTLSGFDELDRPIVEQQKFSSVVTLQDHQMLHIGTVERRVSLNYNRGIPGLGSIPVLKHAFGVGGKRAEESRLYVIATPCYCNALVYDARIKGEPGAILRVGSAKTFMKGRQPGATSKS
jgi:type II secretory pathway component GspD/PulD (secretin)